MDVTITFDKVTALVGPRLPSLAPRPTLKSIRVLRQHHKRALQNLPCPQSMLEEEVPTELKVLPTLIGTLMSLLKHTTEDPAPGCLSKRHIVKMIYFKL